VNGMKIKLDENLPLRLAHQLRQMGHDVDTVPEEGLAGHIDPDVWQGAQENGRFLITQDLDFSDARHFVPGTHHGILLVRLGNPGRQALLHRIDTIFQTENVAEWDGCFVVVTDRKIRIKRP
jgi:predicted nuclease of predicted toxin-antitoxin system